MADNALLEKKKELFVLLGQITQASNDQLPSILSEIHYTANAMLEFLVKEAPDEKLNKLIDLLQELKDLNFTEKSQSIEQKVFEAMDFLDQLKPQ